MKLGTNHPLVEGIQNWCNKGQGRVQSGDTSNYKNVKIGRGHLKNFLRTKGSEKMKFT
jgi:hypothetical protein